MSNYLIKNSTHGPAVLVGDDLIFVSEGAKLFELADEEPSFLTDLYNAVSNFLKDEVLNLLETMELYRRYDTAPGFNALNVLHNYNRFIFNEYVEYRASVAETLEGVKGLRERHIVMKHNPKHVNDFYALLESNVDNRHAVQL